MSQLCGREPSRGVSLNLWTLRQRQRQSFQVVFSSNSIPVPEISIRETSFLTRLLGLPGPGTPAKPSPDAILLQRFWKPADEAGGRTEARHPPRPLSLRVWLQPPGQDRAGGAEPGRQRGRGRPPRFEHRSSRSTPAPAGAAGTGRVVTTRKRRAVRSSPGLPLTSLRRPTSAVAGPLLLPPLLLTSTSLCRKVDPAPRPTHTQRRKRSSEVWDQASGEGKEEGGGEGWEERDVTTSRGRKAAWGRRLGEPLPFQRLQVPGCRGPWAGRGGRGLARARGPSKRPWWASLFGVQLASSLRLSVLLKVIFDSFKCGGRSGEEMSQGRWSGQKCKWRPHTLCLNALKVVVVF